MHRAIVLPRSTYGGTGSLAVLCMRLIFCLVLYRKTHWRNAEYVHRTRNLAITNSVLQLTELRHRLVSFQVQLQCTLIVTYQVQLQCTLIVSL